MRRLLRALTGWPQAAVSKGFNKVDARDIAALPPAAVVDLLSSEDLCADSEDAVLDAVVAYAAGRSRALPPESQARLWGCIRFPFLSVSGMLRASATPGVPPHFLHEALFARSLKRSALTDYVGGGGAARHPGGTSRLMPRPRVGPPPVAIAGADVKSMSHMDASQRAAALAALGEWLYDVPGRAHATCTRLFRATENGWNSSHFHRDCDNKGSTLVIARTDQNCVFGGYAHEPWDTTNGWRSASHCFLFRLFWNSQPDKAPVRATLATEPRANAMYCHSSYGPTFGNGHDWNVGTDMKGNASSVNVGSAYKLPEGETNVHFPSGDSGRSFHLAELEVWQVSPPAS